MNRMEQRNHSVARSTSPASPNTTSPHAPAPLSATILNIRIDRLTLGGLTQAAPKAVIASMQRHLLDLTRDQPYFDWGSLRALNDLHAPFKLDGGELPSNASSEQVGSQLAQSILRKISSAERRERIQDRSP